MRDERLLSISEAARRLQCARGTVAGMLARGELPGVRFARRSVRIPASAVDRVLAAVNSDPAPQPPIGWVRWLGTLRAADFDDDARGVALLEAVARLACTPTGAAFSTDINQPATITAVAVTDRVAAISFLAAFLPSAPGAEDDSLVIRARDLFERHRLWDVLRRLAHGDPSDGGSSLPRDRPLSPREQLLARGVIESLANATPACGPVNLSGTGN